MTTISCHRASFATAACARNEVSVIGMSSRPGGNAGKDAINDVHATFTRTAAFTCPCMVAD
ncbi:hypothetical protein Ptr902_00623 [Pyrenophora tritici-repentis]|nr:hypothetical protein Ptr902_00623 [Pyrenophora tritici-repentis]